MTEEKFKNWWDQKNLLEPKRSFRWEVEYTKNDELADGFENVLIPPHYILSVKMPSFSFSKEEVEVIGAKRVLINPNPTFSPVEITFIDDENNNIYKWLYWYFYNTGIKLDGSNVSYSFGYYNYSGNYAFAKAANFFGSFKIYTLESTKTQEESRRLYRIDEIELVKPFITDFKQSDLNYSDNGFITYTIQITYASYKYITYSSERESFNNTLKEQFGQPVRQPRRTSGAAPEEEIPIIDLVR